MTEKIFTLYWRTGERNVVTGQTISDAMGRSGYDNGSARALDFWEYGNDSAYAWDDKSRTWYSERRGTEV